MTAKTAIERFPELTDQIICKAKLPFKVAQNQALRGNGSLNVKTYAASDIEALVARRRRPTRAVADPLWAAVESGARLTMKTAVLRYPTLTNHSMSDSQLPFRRTAPSTVSVPP